MSDLMGWISTATHGANADDNIIAILSIQETRKKSFRASYERVMASLIAIGMGALMFTLLGYSPATLTLYFVMFIPLVQQLKLQDGMITSVVILTH